jgi:hypothetical protein
MCFPRLQNKGVLLRSNSRSFKRAIARRRRCWASSTSDTAENLAPTSGVEPLTPDPRAEANGVPNDAMPDSTSQLDMAPEAFPLIQVTGQHSPVLAASTATGGASDTPAL